MQDRLCMSTVEVITWDGCIEPGSMTDCSVYEKRRRLGIAGNDDEALCLIYVLDRIALVVVKAEDI